MEKTQLRKIIRESIKELIKEQPVGTHELRQSYITYINNTPQPISNSCMAENIGHWLVKQFSMTGSNGVLIFQMGFTQPCQYINVKITNL